MDIFENIMIQDCKRELGVSETFTIGDRVEFKLSNTNHSGTIVGITVHTNPVNAIFKIKTDIFKPISSDMHHMTIEQFIKDVNDGMLSDDDGFAEYATANQVSNVYIDASDIEHDYRRPKWATHVVWYND